MSAWQSCAWCGELVHIREDLDTDEKSICPNCFGREVEQINKTIPFNQRNSLIKPPKVTWMNKQES